MYKVGFYHSWRLAGRNSVPAPQATAHAWKACKNRFLSFMAPGRQVVTVSVPAAQAKVHAAQAKVHAWKVTLQARHNHPLAVQ